MQKTPPTRAVVFLRIYRNGFGVLRFRDLACIPRPGRGGDHEVGGRVEKNEQSGKQKTTPAFRHSSAGGELAFPGSFLFQNQQKRLILRKK